MFLDGAQLPAIGTGHRPSRRPTPDEDVQQQVQQPHRTGTTVTVPNRTTDLRQRPSMTALPLDGEEKVRARARSCPVHARWSGQTRGFTVTQGPAKMRVTCGGAGQDGPCAHSQADGPTRCGALSGLGWFVEANPVGSRVDKLHLPAVART
jgi:hypothetical protein